MSCDRYLEMLDPWVDGDLSSVEAEEVASHLASCVSCDREAMELLDLLARADALPRAAEPSRDLWPDIARQLPTKKPSTIGQPGWAFVSWRWIAAASLLLVLGGASGWLLRGQRSLPLELTRGLTPPPNYSTASQQGGLPKRLLSLERSMAELRGEILQEMKATDSSSEELAVVERNLQVMDAALLEIRQALEREPRSLHLHLQWAATLRHQADLLQLAGKLVRGT
ncbi:MAG: zf-HC2 domain-containing protein [Deltaproteobacteria bacterium]|nr:zf-HC2 domain-containing protein [Deltaproteobacteria bacterium]